MSGVVLVSWCATGMVLLDAFVAEGVRPSLAITGVGAVGVVLASRCRQHGVALERAEDVNDPAIVEAVRAVAPDLLVVAGCPRTLGDALLGIARLGAVNFHPSLLPRYRGREPLFWAILAGERCAGITVHRMSSELDAGPVLLQRTVAIEPQHTSRTLARAVDVAAATLVPELCAWLRAGKMPPGVPQGAGARVPPLRPEHGLLDWSRSAEELERLIRACEGEIPAYTFASGTRVIAVAPAGASDDAALAGHAAGGGTVLGIDGEALVVATGRGTLHLPRWRFLDRGHTGAQLAESLGLRIGSRFAANPAY